MPATGAGSSPAWSPAGCPAEPALTDEAGDTPRAGRTGGVGVAQAQVDGADEAVAVRANVLEAQATQQIAGRWAAPCSHRSRSAPSGATTSWLRAGRPSSATGRDLLLPGPVIRTRPGAARRFRGRAGMA